MKMGGIKSLDLMGGNVFYDSEDVKRPYNDNPISLDKARELDLAWADVETAMNLATALGCDLKYAIEKVNKPLPGYRGFDIDDPRCEFMPIGG